MKFVAETVQATTGQVYFKTTCASDMKVSLSDLRGNVVTRTLPFEEFKSLLNMSEKRKESWVHVPKGFIPGSEDSGYLDGYVSEEGFSAVWRVKGQKRPFVHTSGHYRIPFPDLIFLVEVKKGVVYRDFVWVIDEKDQIYQYPFGNVSTAGSVCMGNIKLDGDISIRGYEEEFFLGKTNNDYFSLGNHVKVKYSQDELLRKLDKKEKFPKRWLIKRDTTLKEIIRMANPSNSRY